MSNAKVGSISHGTMRNEDLIPAFGDELVRLDNENEYKNLKRSLLKIVKTGEYDSEEADELLNNDLYEALNMLAPPHCYFGAHPGDGSDYGFWPCEDLDEEFDGLKVNDLSEVPENHNGEVLLVNDHGNTSLYLYTNGSAKEIWSIV